MGDVIIRSSRGKAQVLCPQIVGDVGFHKTEKWEPPVWIHLGWMGKLECGGQGTLQNGKVLPL